jgi:hypothetical protein
MDKNKSINLWRVFQIAATFSLIIVYLIQWYQMILIPPLRTGADFIAFYSAGRIAQKYGFSSAYNIAAQHEIEQIVVGFDLAQEQVLLYNHIPYLVPLLKLLVNADYIGSFIRWVVLMLGVYGIGCIFFLKTIFSNEKNRVHSTLLIGILTFFPFFYSLLIGQDTALLFLGISLWCAGILKKQDWLAATGLALTTVRPHICLTLAIPFFFRYRRIWWRFVIVAGLLMIESILMLGREGTLSFINLLRISANGTWYGMNESAMPNLTGLMWRIFPLLDAGLVHALGWFGYLAGIGLVSVLWIKARELDGRLWGTSIIIALLFAPHLHYHDLTLLVIPLIFAVTLPNSLISQQRLALLPLGISLLMIPEFLRYILPYVLYAALIWWLAKNPLTGINPKSRMGIQSAE